MITMVSLMTPSGSGSMAPGCCGSHKFAPVPSSCSVIATSGFTQPGLNQALATLCSSTEWAEREVGLPSHLAPDHWSETAAERGLLRSVGDSLVLYDGVRLLHCVDPLGRDPVWEQFGELDGERLVALASCPDLNPQHAQLFAVTTTSQLLGWTWRGHDPDRAFDTGWHAWQPDDLEASPVALAGWSLGAGQQEQVIAGADSKLWIRRRTGWAGWSGWEFIGVILNSVALDALSSTTGSVELYAVTEDGELKRKVRDPSSADAHAWSSAEVVGDWPDPAVAVASWSLPDQADDQAVLLSSGELRQRWRRAGTTEWSAWWSAPPAPLPGPATALAGSPLGDGRQALAAYGPSGHLSLRLWNADDGWQQWLPAVKISTQLPTATLPTATLVAATLATGTPAMGTMPAQAETVRTEPAEPAGPSPQATTTADQRPADQRQADHQEAAHALDAARAEEATVLFAGRALLPLLPDDPPQVGPFRLQKRIPGGQASTDKYVARDGRGYCFLKVLRLEASDDEQLAFRRESAMAQRVVDRHRLASFIDARPGSDGQPAYLALSFEQGKHLGELCDGRPLPPAELQLLARSLLEALVELRECGVLHLDIKPSNVIMRNDDYPVVVDYGSAVPAETTTVLQAAFGTPAYAAPEFVAQRNVNPTTDTYSWGAVLLAAATGQTPDHDPNRRAEQIATLPEPLADLVATALADDPANRLTLDDAVKRLTRTQPLGPAGVGIRDRLPVEGLTPIALPVPRRLSPSRLVEWLADLTTWQYRAGAGAAAVVGIVLGFLVGVFLLQLLRSI